MNIKSSMTDSIASTLHELGIAANIKGYYYLLDAIVLVINTKKLPVQMNTDIYLFLAQKYDKTMASVEKCMRFAIEEGFNRAPFRCIEKTFSSTISYSKAKPTNSQFIHMIADEYKRNQL